MTRSVTIHGIRNCDTMKKARAWLEEHGIAHHFHDYKVACLDRAMLDRWLQQVPWETLLNSAGTTFRKLPDARKEGLDQAKAVALMLDQPSVAKRPVLEVDGKVTIGFAPAAYAALFGR
jgi:arsenate reductase